MLHTAPPAHRWAAACSWWETWPSVLVHAPACPLTGAFAAANALVAFKCSTRARGVWRFLEGGKARRLPSRGPLPLLAPAGDTRMLTELLEAPWGGGRCCTLTAGQRFKPTFLPARLGGRNSQGIQVVGQSVWSTSRAPEGCCYPFGHAHLSRVPAPSV